MREGGASRDFFVLLLEIDVSNETSFLKCIPSTERTDGGKGKVIFLPEIIIDNVLCKESAIIESFASSGIVDNVKQL